MSTTEDSVKTLPLYKTRSGRLLGVAAVILLLGLTRYNSLKTNERITPTSATNAPSRVISPLPQVSPANVTMKAVSIAGTAAPKEIKGRLRSTEAVLVTLTYVTSQPRGSLVIRWTSQAGGKSEVVAQGAMFMPSSEGELSFRFKPPTAGWTRGKHVIEVFDGSFPVGRFEFTVVR